jgi:hypothetical protein
MAKGPIITDEVKRIIAAVYDAHRDWSAKQVQFAVDKRLHGNGPKLSATQKELAKIRKTDEDRTPESKGLDEPWSLASSSINPEYELPPEVIPIVLEAKRIRSRFIKGQLRGHFGMQTAYIVHELREMPPECSTAFLENMDKPKQPLSVREAKWIARIYYVLKDRVTPEGIYYWAQFYADYEKACELAGITCNTSDMDNALVTGDFYAYLYWLLELSATDEQKKEADDMDRNEFGYILEDIELSQLGWTLYELWLNSIIHEAEKWPNLSIEEREDIVKRLRDWVLEQEPVEELSYPKELLEEVKYVPKLFSITR